MWSGRELLWMSSGEIAVIILYGGHVCIEVAGGRERSFDDDMFLPEVYGSEQYRYLGFIRDAEKSAVPA